MCQSGTRFELRWSCLSGTWSSNWGTGSWLPVIAVLRRCRWLCVTDICLLSCHGVVGAMQRLLLLQAIRCIARVELYTVFQYFRISSLTLGTSQAAMLCTHPAQLQVLSRPGVRTSELIWWILTVTMRRLAPERQQTVAISAIEIWQQLRFSYGTGTSQAAVWCSPLEQLQVLRWPGPRSSTSALYQAGSPTSLFDVAKT